ncbi:MAG: OmpA family protein [Kiloniellaceae bacterium]
MSRFAQHGRKPTENRACGHRFGQACAAAGSLTLTLSLALFHAPEALAQARSGIYINNDVLNSLGPGPGAAPAAPLAPAAPALPSAPALPGAASPQLAPPPQGGSGGLTFQTYGSGDFVVTRPGTLLFPPLEDPTSTLAPGFTSNHAARSEAMSNAFAEGPEPTSQLLIPLQNPSADNDSIVVYMDNLPTADPDAGPGSAPVLTLRRPPLAAPQPAPRKPAVPERMLAESGASSIDDTTAELAPEFRTVEPEAAGAPAMAESPEIAAVDETPLEEIPAADTRVSEVPAALDAPVRSEIPVRSEVPVPSAPAASVAGAGGAPTGETMSEPMQAAEAAATPARQEDAAMSGAPTAAAPAMSEVPAQAAPQDTAEGPVSLLPSGSVSTAPAASDDAPAPVAYGGTASPSDTDATAPPASGVQTASLTVGAAAEGLSFAFDSDSAELSDRAQMDLRSLARSLRASDDSRIQVLGFAAAQDGSQDLARKLALSRALKVRTFLIDAGVPSARIQVRSLGDKSGGGPANRVDIRPFDS